MNEIWRPVPGYNNAYEASSFGRIRSIDRIGLGRFRSGKQVARKFSGVVLSPRISNSGYLRCLMAGKTVSAHRVIAEAFIANPSALPCVNHIDGCKTNNQPANLEWCSHKENTAHAHSTGLLVPKTCQESHAAKLTDNQVREIRNLMQECVSQRQIAAMFGMSQRAIAAISTGRSWANLA